MPVSIKDQLAKLVCLQTIYSKLYRTQDEIQAMPGEIGKLTMAFEEKKKNMADLENKQKDLLKKRKDKELELSVKEENIKKYQTQLYSIKTNKEYQAMMKEIGSLKADSSVFEEDILKLMVEQDALNDQINSEKVRLQEEEKLFNQQKLKIEEQSRQFQEEVKTLNFKRSQIVPEIDKKTLSAYERILKVKEGLALVPVGNNICQGCSMTVTHQVVNEIKMFDRLVTCEMCARILYIEEDLNISQFQNGIT